MENNNELGKTLKEYRELAFKEEGLRKAAEKIGISYAHLFRIETGGYVPNDETLLMLLDAYKVNDPTDRARVFKLAHAATRHGKIYEKIMGEAAELNAQKFAQVFYRRRNGKNK